MSVAFEAANEEHDDRLKILVRMPDRHWFSIGFGSDMTDTDMIAWHADGEASYVKDYWSTKKGAPKEDDVQSVTYNDPIVIAPNKKTNF